MRHKIQYYIVACAILATQNSLQAFEREQDVPPVVQKEQQLVLHFMQGRNYFKDSMYDKAKAEFLQVIEMNADYKPAYEYLERIQDIEIQHRQAEEDKYKHIDTVMQRVENEKNAPQRKPTDDDLFYQLTDSEQKKLDGYVGDREFGTMLEEQRVAVQTKAKNVKQDIDKVLEEGRKKDVMHSVKGKDEETPFLIRGFEARTEEPATMTEKVSAVQEAQEEVDANFYFDRKSKIKDFYEKGVMAYKQKDYHTAKKYFEEVVKLEPGYKYAQDYYESSKSQMVLQEIEDRRVEERRRAQGAPKRTPVQTGIEEVSEVRLSKESEKIADDMSMAFEERKGADLMGRRKELLRAGVESFKNKDYRRALDLFEHVLRFDPKNTTAKKYRQQCLDVLNRREDAVLEAVNSVKTVAEHEHIPTDTVPAVLEHKAERIQGDETVDDQVRNRDDRRDQLYEQGKMFYRAKDYGRALELFKELERIDPAHRYVDKYIRRCEELLPANQAVAPVVAKEDVQQKYQDAMQLYKSKHYKPAARLFWSILKTDPEHKKAQGMFKRCLAKLKMDISAFLAVDKDNASSVQPHLAPQSVAPKPVAMSSQAAPAQTQLSAADVQDLYNKAQTLYRERRFQEAIPLFEQVASALPLDAQAKRYLERSKERAAEEAVATPAVSATTEENTSNSNQNDIAELYEQAKQLYREEKYQEAIVRLEKVVQSDPQNVYAPRYLERSREKLAELQAATTSGGDAAAMPQAVAPEGGDFTQYYEAGKTYYRQGDYAQAIPQFEKAVSLDPNHAYAPRYLQKSKEKLAEMAATPASSAETEPAPVAPVAAQSVAEAGGDFTQYYEAGKTYYRDGNYAAAIAQFEKAVALDPNHTYAPRYLERSREKLAQSSSSSVAPAAMPVVATPANEDATAIYEQAKEDYRSENYVAAAKGFEHLLRLDPNHAYAGRYLEKIRAKLAEAPQTSSQPVAQQQLSFQRKVEQPVAKVEQPAIQPKPVVPVAVAPQPKPAKPKTGVAKVTAAVKEKSSHLLSGVKGLVFNRKTPVPYPPTDPNLIKRKVVRKTPKREGLLSHMKKGLSGLNSGNSRSYYRKGLKYVESKEFLLAAEAFERAYILDVHNDEAYHLMETSIQSLEKRGVPYLKLGVLVPRSSSEKKYAAARNAFYAGQLAQARVYLQQALEEEPCHTIYRQALKSIGEQTSEKQRRSDPEKQALLKTLYAEGARYFNKGNYEKAVAVFVQALELVPQNEHVQKALALSRKRLAQAQAPVVKALSEEEAYEKGKEFFVQGKYPEAANMFRIVLHYNPQHLFATKYLEKIQAMSTTETAVAVPAPQVAASGPAKVFDKKKSRTLKKAGSSVAASPALAAAVAPAVEPVAAAEAQAADEFSRQMQRMDEEAQSMANQMALFYKAKDLYDQGLYEEALAQFRSILAVNPNNTYAQTFAAYAEKRMAERRELDASLQKVEQLQKTLEKQYSVVSPLSVSTPAKAQPIYPAKQIETEVAVKTISVKDLLKKAKAAMKKDNYAEALNFLKLAWQQPEAGSYAEEIQKQLEVCYQRLGQQSGLSESASVIRQRDTLMREAEGLFQQKQWELAVVGFQKVLNLDPSFALAQKYKDVAQRNYEEELHSKERQLEQLALMQQLSQLAEQEKTIEQWLAAGKEAYENSQYALAQEYFKKIIALDAQHRLAHDFLILVEDAMAKKQLQEEQNLTEIHLKSLKEERRRTVEIQEQKKREEMIIIKRQHDDTVALLFRSGKTLYEQGLYADAAEKFEAVLKIEPQHKMAFEYLTMCHQQLDSLKNKEAARLREEQESLSRVEAQKVTRATEAYEKGMKAYKLGHDIQAIAYFKRVWEIDRQFSAIDDVQRYIELASERMARPMPEKDYVADLYSKGKHAFIAEQWQEAYDYFYEVSRIDAHYESVSMYLQVVKSELKPTSEKAQPTDCGDQKVATL